MLQDYTQQREAAEEVLRRGEERYRRPRRQSGHGRIPARTAICAGTFLNPAWETVTGRSPRKACGQVATALMVDVDATECGAELRALLDGPAVAGGAGSYACAAPPVQVHWLELRAIPMLVHHGNIVGVSGTLSDVTARVSAESSSAASRRSIGSSRELERHDRAHLTAWRPVHVRQSVTNTSWGIAPRKYSAWSGGRCSIHPTRSASSGRCGHETGSEADAGNSPRSAKGWYLGVARGPCRLRARGRRLLPRVSDNGSRSHGSSAMRARPH
jgi:hypothetical protein